MSSKAQPSQLKFRGYQLEAFTSIPYLTQKIQEVIAHGSFAISLSEGGICTLHDRCTLKEMTVLNFETFEGVRSMFLNHRARDLILVSIDSASTQQTSLKCRVIAFDCLEKFVSDPQNSTIESRNIFPNEQICWPGFVEFDDVNGKVLTFAHENVSETHGNSECQTIYRVYKIWSLVDYSFLWVLRDQFIDEVKISYGVILFAYRRKRSLRHSFLPLKLFNIENGTVLREMKHLLKSNRKIVFLEQFHEQLLIKQYSEPLQILNVGFFP